MALRVECNKHTLINAIETQLASVRRAQNTKKDPRMQPIFEADLRELLHALNSITEIK